jgi:hypothetical protein
VSWYECGNFRLQSHLYVVFVMVSVYAASPLNVILCTSTLFLRWLNMLLWLQIIGHSTLLTFSTSLDSSSANFEV